MEMAAGEAEPADLRVVFDRRVKLEFHGCKVTFVPGVAPGGENLTDGTHTIRQILSTIQ